MEIMEIKVLGEFTDMGLAPVPAPISTRYIMDAVTKIPLDADSYHDREIILAAGFDPNDDEYTVSDLTDEWNGHPAGSHAVIGMTVEGHPFAIVED